MNVLILLSLVCVSGYVHSANVRVDPLVLIDQGLVRGFKASGGDYSTFLGIPYAKVDLANPFGPTLPASHFQEPIFEANNGEIMCPQVTVSKSSAETLDCLRLNVYVPSAASTTNPLPVMVWIHGGAFETGYGANQNPKDLVKKGIVVVTINYRLGPYGFMCLHDPKVPGNQGLKDQYQALRWVRDNIAAFGGNPYQVTIAGQSAGSASVLLHLYSSKEKLYKQVIAQSGSPKKDGSFNQGDVAAAKKLASHLGFNTNDTASALQFLTTTSPDLVTAATVELGLNFRPCLEKSFSGVDNFVEADPYSLSNPKKVKNTAVMIGHTSVEYAMGAQTSSKVFPSNYLDSDPFIRRIQNNFALDDDKLQEAANLVRHFYIGDDTASENNKNSLANFESDFLLNHPIQDDITNLVKENAGPVYEYMFSFTDTDNIGASHVEDVTYLLHIFEQFKTGKCNEALITEIMTTLWTNFVKYGNPTPEASELLPVKWEPVTSLTRPYLNIDTTLELGHRVFQERMAFWNLFTNLYGKHNKLAQKCTH